MPTRHQKQQQWKPGRLKNWAQDIGRDTLIWNSDRLDEREHPEQAYRVCSGLLNLSKEYPSERLNTASRIANREGLDRLKHIKAILRSNRDKLLGLRNCQLLRELFNIKFRENLIVV